MANPGIPMADQIEAASALMPYHHERLASEEDEDDQEMGGLWTGVTAT